MTNLYSDRVADLRQAVEAGWQLEGAVALELLDRIDRLEGALRKIASPTYSENPLVFTLEMIEIARSALEPRQSSVSVVEDA